MIQLIALAFGALAVAAGSATAAVPTSAGSPDPTFGSGGRVIVNPTALADDWGGGVLQPDGKLVVTGYVARDANTSSLAAIRLLDSGAPDPAFGTGGVATLPVDQNSGADYTGPALDAAGRIFIAGYSQPETLFGCMVAALRPDGALDASFADAGIYRFQLTAGHHTNCSSVAVRSDNRLVVLGHDGTAPYPAFLLRLSGAGVRDAGFGEQGIASVPRTGISWTATVLGPGDAIFISGTDFTKGYVMKFTADGALDTSFGTGGVFETPFGDAGFYKPQPLADGGLLLAGRHGTRHMLIKLRPDGTPDPAFGVAGVAEFVVGSGYAAIGTAVQADGRIVAGLRLTTSAKGFRLAAIRLLADGTLDPSYGVAGLATVDADGGDEVNYAMALAPDGKLWLFGRVDLGGPDSGLVVARLLGNEITTSVAEFHNTTLDHYFITADPAEATAIDAGAAGPGWSRTGQTFKSGGPNRVCRFYGSPETDPATGARRGPNSHFYTIEAAECAAVKQDAGWRFESYDFNGWPAAAGACPADTVAVKRAYNNRFAANDSNHRYTTSDAIYAQMLAQGWSGEGVVFCAVQ